MAVPAEQCIQEASDKFRQLSSLSGAVSDDNLLLLYIKKNYLADFDRLLFERPHLIHKKLECAAGEYGTGLTALHLVCFYLRPEMARILLEHGATVNASSDVGATALWILLGFNERRWMLDDPENRWGDMPPAPVRIPVTTFDAHSALCEHIEFGDTIHPGFTIFGSKNHFTDLFQLLIAYGADPNSLVCSESQQNKLLLVSEMFKIRTLLPYAEALFESSLIRIRATGELGVVLMASLARSATEYPRVISLFAHLFSSGADINGKDARNHQQTVLHHLITSIPKPKTADNVYASAEAEARIVPILKFLLAAQADPSAQDDLGCTPLHAAVDRICPLCIELLLDAGSDANLQNRNGRTPLLQALDDSLLLEQLQVYSGDRPQRELADHKQRALTLRTKRLADCITAFTNDPMTCQTYAPISGSDQLVAVADCIRKLRQDACVSTKQSTSSASFELRNESQQGKSQKDMTTKNLQPDKIYSSDSNVLYKKS